MGLLLRRLVVLSTIFAGAFAQTSLSTIIGTCTTKLGAKSFAVLGTITQQRTVTSNIHITTTSTPSTTVYPSTEVTSTSTVTSMTTFSITEPALTDYYTSTSTNYQTTTATVTTDTTTTTTSDTSVFTTQTITIPTSAGFVPVASGLGYPGAKKRDAALTPHNRLDVEARKAAAAVPAIKVVAGAAIFSPVLYPQAVTCNVLIDAFTTHVTSRTAKLTVTVTAPPFTSTAFTTTTISTTTTIIPADIQVTTIFVDEIAVSTTTTSTQTSTSTATNTVTIAAPSATYYDACAPNNVVGSASGGTFDSLQVTGNVQPAYWSQQASAYDCCVQCMTTANCAGASYAGRQCMVYPVGGTGGTSGGTCNANTFIGDFFNSGFPGASPWTVINGNCGQFGFGMGACYRNNKGFC